MILVELLYFRVVRLDNLIVIRPTSWHTSTTPCAQVVYK